MNAALAQADGEEAISLAHCEDALQMNEAGAASSCDSLDYSELISPRAPNFDPRFVVAKGENHQLLVDQIVPVVIWPWPVPPAQNGINVRLEIKRILSPVNVVVSTDDVPAGEIIIVTEVPLPTVRAYPCLQDFRPTSKHSVYGWKD